MTCTAWHRSKNFPCGSFFLAKDGQIHLDSWQDQGVPLPSGGARGSSREAPSKLLTYNSTNTKKIFYIYQKLFVYYSKPINQIHGN
jgi:hypothetical protein